MKTLFTLVLLLALATGGLGYTEYRQHLEILDLQAQVSSFPSQFKAEDLVIISQQQALSKVKSKEQVDRKVLSDILDFLTHLDVEPEPKSGPRS